MNNYRALDHAGLMNMLRYPTCFATQHASLKTKNYLPGHNYHHLILDWLLAAMSAFLLAMSALILSSVLH
jgi:hypothetical protein